MLTGMLCGLRRPERVDARPGRLLFFTTSLFVAMLDILRPVRNLNSLSSQPMGAVTKELDMTIRHKRMANTAREA